MRKSVFVATALIFVCGHSLFSQGVTLFRDANFSGPSVVITEDWDASSNMKWNDQISSIRIPAGYKIQVFEHTNFGGVSKTLSGDWTVTNGDFNDF
ncbi:MAG TPA: beta/gamma crystallin-related protein, partial [Cyclobacteriaceae bacterium]|nr:beta/gamma crystallin-related protein [Cyclobacteriaceae bacterium]